MSFSTLSHPLSITSVVPSSQSAQSTAVLFNCTYCNKNLAESGDGFCHPFWVREEVLCRQCCDQLPICVFCEKRTSSPSSLRHSSPNRNSSSSSSSSIRFNSTTTIPSGIGKEVARSHRDQDFVKKSSQKCEATALPSTINTCESCASLPRIRSTDLQPLLLSVSCFLSRTTNIPFQSVVPSVRLKLAGVREIAAIAAKRFHSSDIRNLQLDSSPATTFGVCVCNPGSVQLHRTLTNATVSNRVDSSIELSTSTIDILLLRGLSFSLAGAFLAHELIHALLHCLRQESRRLSFYMNAKLPRCNMGSCDVFLYEEGLCHLAAASWLTLLLGKNQLNPIQSATASNSISIELETASVYRNRSEKNHQAQRQIQFWLKKLLSGGHPEFSIGLKAAKQIVESVGWGLAVSQLLIQERCNKRLKNDS